MKRIIWIAVIVLYLMAGCGQKENEVYLFSFFQGNGEDGLHLAHSYDGLTWEALNNNHSFLTPQVGNDKLMRDPCIISDQIDFPEGTRHGTVFKVSESVQEKLKSIQ